MDVEIELVDDENTNAANIYKALTQNDHLPNDHVVKMKTKKDEWIELPPQPWNKKVQIGTKLRIESMFSFFIVVAHFCTK